MPTPESLKRYWLPFAAVSSLIGYYLLVYRLDRVDATPLLATYFLLFGVYIITALLNRNTELDDGTYRKMDLLAIMLRGSLLLALPNLSDDFYRFIWDGRLLVAGINPFSELPSFYIDPNNQVPGLDTELFQKLNSPEYFTIYPPLNQFIFWFASLISGDSVFGAVLVMRIFILCAEVGNLWLLPRVLEQYGIKRQAALFYTLNPLVIIEGVGNLHFEVMMFTFILLTLYWLRKDRLILSAAAIALAVATKLIPLIFLPFLPRPLSIKRLVVYYAVAGLTIVVLFAPLISRELIDGMRSSVSLYYQKFEFNASIYFILREIGFNEYGYNRIEFIGKDLARWTFWLILALAFWPFGKKPSLPLAFMFALGIYFLLSTTIHPWYVITLVGLSVFTNYRSPILWSATIFLTYIGYSISGFQLPCWVLYVEYGSLFVFFGFELSRETGLINYLRSKVYG